ncbi:hypothetical protein [Chthonobacter albigriseus]|uniref:hypothetical protein n=1 Tax=Chthonobacter albigriseus TaxID=1683161 RepID=UPI0015EFD906|nr:hypothetical protein [Chthonobacter albigriseus]
MQQFILPAAIVLALLTPLPVSAEQAARPCAVERDEDAAAATGPTDEKQPVADATAAEVAEAAGQPGPTGATTGGTDAPVEGSEAWSAAHGSTAAVGENGDCTLSIGQ